MRSELVVVVLLACGGADVDTTTTPSEEPRESVSESVWPQSAGLHRIDVELDGASAMVGVHVPSDLSSPRPLAIALHYAGEPTPYYGADMLEILYVDGLSELDAVIVAPNVRGDQGWSTEANQAMLRALYDAVVTAYPIDESKVLLTGYSMGGMGTWDLVASGALPITAAMPVSGIPNEPLTSAASSIPVHAVHSTADEAFPITAAREAVQQLQSYGREAELSVADGLDHYDVGAFAGAVNTAASWIAERW